MNETQAIILLATILGAISMWQVLPRSEAMSGRVIAKLTGIVCLLFAALLVYLYFDPPPYGSVIAAFGGKAGFWIFEVALAAIGLFFLLPRFAKVQARAVGVILGLVSLGLFFSRVPVVGHWASHSVFWLLAATTIISAAASVTLRSPVYCAIWFAMTLLGTAGLFLFQGAQFLGIATVVVYAGAILVTFLFVLMLAQPQGQAYFDRLSWEGFLSASAGALLVGILTLTLSSYFSPPRTPDAPALPPLTETAPADLKKQILADQHVAHIGKQLFSRHLIAVEVAGTLLMVALVGAIAIVAQARSIGQPQGGRVDG